jgi:hypothetical protein
VADKNIVADTGSGRPGSGPQNTDYSSQCIFAQNHLFHRKLRSIYLKNSAHLIAYPINQPEAQPSVNRCKPSVSILYKYIYNINTCVRQVFPKTRVCVSSGQCVLRISDVIRWLHRTSERTGRPGYLAA